MITAQQWAGINWKRGETTLSSFEEDY